MMYQIILPYAVFGIVTDEQGIVVASAPIGDWMKGKHLNRVKEWIQTKKGTIINCEVSHDLQNY